MGDVTYETYQCTSSYSQIVQQGINVKQQVTKPNAEIQLKAPSLSVRPGIYFLLGFAYNRDRRLIEGGFYSRKYGN